MSQKYIEILNTFDIDTIPNLDVVVLGALELFQQSEVPSIDTKVYNHPLVVGSGNAEATGRILFAESDAVFASESNFEDKLRNIPSIDGVVLVSASGGKHAPLIAKKARELNKPVTLLTNTNNSPTAIEMHGDSHYSEHIFPKNREPYTYNTSTYMSMILGKTGENAAAIDAFLREHVETIAWPDFSQYDKYYVIIPPQFSAMVRMVQVKFIELFGRNIARDVETTEYVRHATTVAPSNELFISFGEENTQWGKPENRLHVPLPDTADYATMMAASYYTIAQIQAVNEHLFKDNIADYTKSVSALFGETIRPIVENS